MKPLPYLATLTLFALAATGCVMDVEPEVEVTDSAEADESSGSLPEQERGAAPPCAQDLVIGEDGELIQEPVLCDPYAEMLPGTEHVRDPYEESIPIHQPVSDPL